MTRCPFEMTMIDGFRGLRGLRLEGLGRINLLVGANNSGKTSVLEALSILGNPLEPLEWLAMVKRRDFGGLDETRIQSLRWCFPNAASRTDADALFSGQCRMTSDGAFPLRALTVLYQEIEGEPDPSEFRPMAHHAKVNRAEVGVPLLERGAEISHVIQAEPPLGTGNGKATGPIAIRVWEQHLFSSDRRRVRRDSIPTETLTPYSYQINRFQVSKHSKTLFGSSRDLLLELVRDFDPDVRGVEIASMRGERPAIYVDHRRLGVAPLSVFGDAMRRAVMLASTLPTLAGGGLLLIDEIETGIHFGALGRVFDWLQRASRDLGVQVVATTHSLEAVDAIALAAEGSLDEIVTYHLEQAEDVTRVKRIDGDLLLRLRRERGLDVR